tara:strand:- start:1104 stop:1397 length:294 start_codon:yes stop_codon:yes gene_type:complete
MEKSKYSAYDNYLLMADKTNKVKLGYHYFLDYQETLKILSIISNTSNNFSTYLYNGSDYKKIVTSAEASKAIQSNEMNSTQGLDIMKRVATQHGLRF